jgi:hypothetical protein
MSRDVTMRQYLPYQDGKYLLERGRSLRLRVALVVKGGRYFPPMKLAERR